MTIEHVVLDASALIDLVCGRALGTGVRDRIDGCALHAPALLDAEVLSGLGRLHRSGELTADTVTAQLDAVSTAPIERHRLPPLLAGAWARRHQLRLADALYVELADQLEVLLITTDQALGRATDTAQVVTT
jgi:predicted nucleic acid-binding protein